MERITIRGQHGIAVNPSHDFHIDPVDYDLVQRILERLAAYEDTGLEPEEVVAMQHTMEAYHKEADPLLKAKALGRLLVLPAAPGETVYYADEDAGRVMMGYVNGYRIRNNGAMSLEFFNLELDVEWHSISLPVGEFGKTVFLKEEEAEKVMEACEPDD